MVEYIRNTGLSFFNFMLYGSFIIYTNPNIYNERNSIRQMVQGKSQNYVYNKCNITVNLFVGFLESKYKDFLFNLLIQTLLNVLKI